MRAIVPEISPARFSVALTCIGLSTGCGGGATSIGQPAILSPFEVTVAEFDRTYLARSRDQRPSFPPANSSLQAQYSGTAHFEQLNRAGSNADLELMAEFNIHAIVSGRSSNISGSFTNFVANRSLSYSGSLEIVEGKFDLSSNSNAEFHYAGRLSGQLDVDGNTVVQVTGGLNGDLLGDNYQHTLGDALIVISQSSGATQLHGRFVSR